MSGPTEHIRTAVVGGTGQQVRRSRVVFLSGEHQIAEASVNTSLPALGIAQEFCRNPPGTPFDTSLVAGNSGDEVKVYEDGAVCYAECGGTVTAGKYQTWDSTARIVDATGSPPWSFFAVFQAEQNGSTGQLVRGIVRT